MGDSKGPGQESARHRLARGRAHCFLFFPPLGCGQNRPLDGGGHALACAWGRSPASGLSFPGKGEPSSLAPMLGSQENS